MKTWIGKRTECTNTYYMSQWFFTCIIIILFECTFKTDSIFLSIELKFMIFKILNFFNVFYSTQPISLEDQAYLLG